MAETLLSPSNVLLFGRKMNDLAIVDPIDLPENIRYVDLLLPDNFDPSNDVPETVDGVLSSGSRKFLLKASGDKTKIGVYKRKKKEKNKLEPVDLNKYDKKVKEFNIFVSRGATKGLYKISKFGEADASAATVPLESDERHGPFASPRGGIESEIEQQLLSVKNPCLARIYGFSFEGYYYDLPKPIIFLVHGDGESASEARGQVNRARAPADPSLTGIGQADFQFSDDMMVWSYDKADYTIRMDVETGMFEDVLLGMFGGGPGGMESAGMNARGMNARGMNARGMNARGMNARGMNARGGGNSD
ncbi:MAG: hypothetical protein ACAH83_18070 [Alphaproteobacteria bacterium]